MMVKTDDQLAAFEAAAAAWRAEHVAPLARHIGEYAAARGRGRPTQARVLLRDHLDRMGDVADAALISVVSALAHEGGKKLAAIASGAAREVARTLGFKLRGTEETYQLGYVLVALVCESTGAARIADKHGDRPEKVAGGVKLSPVYELQVIKGGFFEAAARFGKVGMPTYTTVGAADWTAQDAGGVPEQAERGLVHGGDKAMAGTTAGTAPALFEAVNHAQRAAFVTNPVTAAVVLKYDAAKAYDWLLAYFLKEGMPQAKAEAAAKEAARL